MTKTDPHPQFFGYGSLVNLATHSYADPTPATLTGWRRVWCHARTRPVAFLSVEPCPKTTLHGITAGVPNANWDALDARENAYLRRDVTAQFKTDTAVYEANPEHTAPPSTGHPILLSYLDVVVSGYTSLMGDDGAAHFFATTHGWGPILDDRDAPLYPRSRPLAVKTRDIVDDAIAALSVLVRPAKDARLLVDAIRAS
ncbi:gamma-glutamylcyclotransferase [Octadecabacter sp. CECT 8868]|uniref:gamma-glutamylcyclotransferase family protein n=1 Tax=Octadecabacter algicola TaxID=2909342 RepID=UPI001F48563E|nr:gamma-glutamylcyclotransferase family protein [Octadecabacter algicola]MCF2905035.1 gamma-glutamylcyclotransferase [Octadecabacter algicola]